MIQFRCWKCHRKYAKAAAAAGERFICTCENILRVPKRSGGNCRVKTMTDRLVEAFVCGGGGALLGFGLAVVIMSRLPVRSAFVIAAMTIAGGLAGFLCGERAIDWIGKLIRDNGRR